MQELRARPKPSSPEHEQCASCKYLYQISGGCVSSRVGRSRSLEIKCYPKLKSLGIYPREPGNRKKASKTSTHLTTFYYTKDIRYLLHESLISKFREHKAVAKKISRFLGRGEVGDAARLEKTANLKISLDHIIKERYPTFVDALRDLDDALSLLSLFANLPTTRAVPPKTTARCQRLILEFQHYLITTSSLKKSFLSIKGIYYQATIQGQDILWLVPYKFVQRVTGDIDFRIMGTFIEFYVTLLGFVNFRLYHSIGLIYPPRFDANSEEQGGELGAFTLEAKRIEASDGPKAIGNGHVNGATVSLEDIQKQVDAINELDQPEHGSEQREEPEEEVVNDAVDTFEPVGEGADTLLQPQLSSSEAAALFAPFSFFLSRETPRQPLEFILRAFGCKRVSWDATLGHGAFTHDENDSSITHQVVDRPPLVHASSAQVSTVAEKSTEGEVTERIIQSGRVPGRTYIQPQWVWDCINEGKLLRPDLYAPGATLPPHLSPWVKARKGTYDPSVPLAEQEREGEAEEAGDLDEADDDDENEAIAAKKVSDMEKTTKSTTKAFLGDSLSRNDMEVAASDSDSSATPSSQSSFAGFDSDPALCSEDEMSAAQTRHQRELEAEAAGLSFTEGGYADGKASRESSRHKTKGEEARRKALKKDKADKEELERRMLMLGNKKRKLVGKMLFSNQKKDQEAERLRAKRRKIEAKSGVRS